jgi:hypothetical protein
VNLAPQAEKKAERRSHEANVRQGRVRAELALYRGPPACSATSNPSK